MKSILGLEIKGVGQGYGVFNRISSFVKKRGIEIETVEATPQPNGLFLIILQGKPQDLFEVKKAVIEVNNGKKEQRILFLEEPSEDLLKSLYSLNDLVDSEAFIIVETKSTLDSLELGDVLQERGCEIVEIKSLRSQMTYSYVVGTGKRVKIDGVCSELREREPYKSQVVDVQIVLEPSEEFRGWFS